jgi:biotin transport system substrate-specific component
MQQTRVLTLADAVLPRFDSKTKAVARDVALMLGFAAFVALFAQIQVRLPWTPVPITGQTFAVLVTGATLGACRGAGSLIIYALIGMFGAPVFTPAAGATAGTWDLHFVLPWSGNEYLLWEATNGGYILGFILAAALIGFLAERRWDRGAWVQAAMLLGNLLIYIPGLLWLGYLIGTDWVPPGGSRPISELIAGTTTLDKTLKGGLYPFIVGDLMKLMLASLVLPGAWALVGRMRPRAGRQETVPPPSPPSPEGRY